MKYYYSIDLIKCSAIISVIFLHLIPKQLLISLYSEFHIWQAVPVFMVVAGFNSTLAITKRKETPITRNYFKINFFKKLWKRILVPFLFFYFLELVFLMVSGDFSLVDSIKSLFKGGYGPGSYYIPIYIQHLFLFPFLYKFYHSKYSFYTKLIFIFLLSVILDTLFSLESFNTQIYRVLIVRYIFVVYLGIAFFSDSRKVIKPLLVMFSVLYILLNHFYQDIFSKVFNIDWGFQHAPSYFYTTLVVFIFFRFNDIKQWKIVKLISASTFHIFLIQMLYFTFLFNTVKELSSNSINSVALSNLVVVVITLIFCVYFGIMFKKINDFLKL